MSEECERGDQPASEDAARRARARVAEQAVLGSLMRDAAITGDVVQIVRPHHFRDSLHRLLFAAMVALYDRRCGIDMVTVAEELRCRGQTAELGPKGIKFLAELW